MYQASQTGWDAAEAERAFVKAVRARRRAALRRRLRRCCAGSARLSVHSEHGPRRGRAGEVREIALDAITGTVESHRAVLFDGEFRPSPPARRRWIAVWLAEHRGKVLPPISVTRIGDAYAIRDGHHRVSVARARGAVTITAAIA